MPEVTTPVTPVQISYICDKCNVGMMTSTGTAQTSFPFSLVHCCDHCGERETFRGKTYPRIEYVTKKEKL